RNAADAKSVAPMNVGHRQAGVLNARQERDVGNLLGRLILADQLDHFVVGIDQSIDAHAGLVTLGDPPAEIVHSLQWAIEGVFDHDHVLSFKYLRSPRRASRRSPAPPSAGGR